MLWVLLDDIYETGESINFQISSRTVRATPKFMLKVKSWTVIRRHVESLKSHVKVSTPFVSASRIYRLGNVAI
jgi:hypothetical protein